MEDRKEQARAEVRYRNAVMLNEVVKELQEENRQLKLLYEKLTNSTQGLLVRVSELENKVNMMRAELHVRK